MRSKSVIAAVLVLLFLLVGASAALADTIHVPGDYATIQAAVDAAASGDVVAVAAGTYPEHVTIAKPLTLTGAGAGATVIDGSGSGPVLTVCGAGVTVRELTVTNGGSDAHPASNGVRVSGATGASFAGVEVSFCEAAYMLVASSGDERAQRLHARQPRLRLRQRRHRLAGHAARGLRGLRQPRHAGRRRDQRLRRLERLHRAPHAPCTTTSTPPCRSAGAAAGWSRTRRFAGNAHGLVLDSSNGGTCRGNEISDNTGYGVVLAGWGTRMDNLFTANAIRGNDQGCRLCAALTRTPTPSARTRSPPTPSASRSP